jgi:hypothetical protein
MTSAMTRRLYVISWLMLGAIALVYFFTLFQTYKSPKSAQTTPSDLARSQTAEKPAGTTDPSLSQALVRMRSEINLLKGSLEAANKKNSALKAHIKTLESTFGQSTSSLPPASALPRQSEEPVPSAIKKEAASRSAPAPKVDITEAPLPIAGESSPKRTLFAVELASGLKANALDARWSKLKRRHPKLLDKLEPRGVKIRPRTAGGIENHKLVAGPFENAASAARLCARLSAAGVKCKGAVFTGAPIGTVAAR